MLGKGFCFKDGTLGTASNYGACCTERCNDAFIGSAIDKSRRAVFDMLVLLGCPAQGVTV